MGYHETYEFLAIDRPLRDSEMRALRRLSSRAVISPTRFYNFYDWGGLKGDPQDMLRRYFDLFIYTGSGGTRWGMLRLPSGSIEPTRWRAYLHQQRGLRPPARRASFVTRGGVAILTFGPPEPGGVSGLSSTGGAEELDDEEGWSAPLALLRADLLGGDLRGLYLMWLASVQAGERRPVEREPLMPPGLAHLTGTLYRVAEFLRLDPGLLSGALSGWKAAPRTAEALLRAARHRGAAVPPSGRRSAGRRSAGREARIRDEIVVDAYTESERAMGWYYYLEGRLRFPFRSRCVLERPASPLKRGQEVDVVGMAPEEACMQEVFVRVGWDRRSLAVPLIQLEPRQVDRETRQAVEDWHYWVRQGYVF
jgi:hypothetical protein